MNIIDKRELRRKLRAAVAMLLVSTVLLMNSSYAWLVLATAPEVTGVTSVIGANGNLEIALATTEHLQQLQENDMYEPEGAEFVMANGDAVHDNVLWGNLLDLLPDDYGLQTLNLRPSMLNTVEGEVSQFPVYIASYGEDGRIGRAAAETKDLYNTCLTALFDKDLYRSIAGSTKLFRIEADAGLLDDEVFLEDMLANVSYGLRLAGPIELKSRQDPDDANFVIVDCCVDGYCFAVDMMFRTNAASANLMLQTEGIQRLETGIDDEYQGQGSFVELDNPAMTSALNVVFADTLMGKVYALAEADPDGKLWITSRLDENGMMVPTDAEDSARILSLNQNQVSAITAWVFLNGSKIPNAYGTSLGKLPMKMNLQFSTDAALQPAYSNVTTNNAFPMRPIIPEAPEMPSNPGIPDDPDAPQVTIPTIPEVPLDKVEYRLGQSGNGNYSVYTENRFGGRSYEMNFEGTLDEAFRTVTINRVLNYPEVGLVIPAAVSQGDTVYQVRLNTAHPFADLNLNKANLSFIPVDEAKVFTTTSVLSDLFRSYRGKNYLNYGTDYAYIDMRGLDISAVTSMEDMLRGCSSLTEVDISGFDMSNVTSMNYMFYGCSNLSAVDLSGLNMSNVTSMASMFSGCSSLTAVNLSGLDTANVTSMASMFYGCSSLPALDLSDLDTSAVTTMASMFYNCSGLTELDLSSFDTSNVTSMGSMFKDCENLTALDVTGFDTGNVTNMSSLFSGCENLTALDVTGFDTRQVTDMSSMFSGCSGLTALDVTGFDTQKVTDMHGMFRNCRGLTSLDVSSFDTGNVSGSGSYYAGMYEMFSGCSGLTSLDITNFNTGKVTGMGSMFSGCSGLRTLDLSGLDTGNVTDISSMFYGCTGLTALDVGVLDTGNVTDMSHLFYNCSGLTTLDLRGLETDKATDMSYLFSGCTGLTSLDLSVLDAGNATNISGLFSGCTGLTALDLSGLETGNVTNMHNMFYGCSALTSLDAGAWNTANVTDMGYMFYECRALISLDISRWNTGNVTSMRYMFAYSSKLTSLDVSSWNVSKVTDMAGMFYYCSALTDLDISAWDMVKAKNKGSMFYGCPAGATNPI